MPFRVYLPGNHRVPPARRACLAVGGLVAYGATLALLLGWGASPSRGFLPIVIDPPPPARVAKGYDGSGEVARVYWRGSAMYRGRPYVRNAGEHFNFEPERGVVSWYGYNHIGREVATGAMFNPEAMTAAHKSLPFGARVRVTRTDTGRRIIVTINDRGPYVEGRVIDLARAPAVALGLKENGIAPCVVEVLAYPGPAAPNN